MTPLKHHIPKTDFRSVFHLREIRSVHDNSLAVSSSTLGNGEYSSVPNQPKSQSKCKCSKEHTKCQNLPRNNKTPHNKSCHHKTSKLNQNPAKDTEDGGHFDKNFLSAQRDKLSLRKLQLTRTKNIPFIPRPLYQPQPTKSRVLNSMNTCPVVLNESLQNHMYRVFVEILGKKQVKLHFHRRGFTGIPEPLPTEDQDDLVLGVKSEVIVNRISATDSSAGSDDNKIQKNLSASAQQTGP